MRVSSSTYTNQLINSSQNEQQQLATLQSEISTGDSVQLPSDNPLAYKQAAQTQTSLVQLNTYNQAASEASTLTTQNNQSMTSLYTAVSQASELATGVTTDMPAASLQAIGTEMQALLTQVISTANQKSSNGTYLFGGTSNQPPIDTSTNTYNSATNANEATIEVQSGNAVQTGILAGRSGSTPVNGFLYNSSTGVDLVGALTQTISDLNSGDASTVLSTDLPAINKALDNVSLYVGSTAADMSAAQTASQSLQQQITSQSDQLNALTQTNLPNESIQLQQISTQYQASLEAGTRIMGLSILNYLSSIPTS